MVTFSENYGFPSSDSDDDVSKTKQQPKQVGKTSVRSEKPNEAGRGKHLRDGGSNQPAKSSDKITDVKDTSVEKPSKKLEHSRKSDIKKQKTGKHSVPSPVINRIDDSATGGKKPERKSHISPDSKNFMEVKNTIELRIRLHCSCGGCISKLRETVLKFKGVQRVMKADEDMVKVIGTMERKEFTSYLEDKLRWNLVVLPIKDYDNVVNDRKEDETETPKSSTPVDYGSWLPDGVPMTDRSLGISATAQPTCQYSRDNDGMMRPFVRKLPRDEQKVTRTVVLRIRLHCQEGCVQQTLKTVQSFKGVESLTIDPDEGQVKVTGTMEVEELVSHLRKKLKREVVLVHGKRTENVTNEYKGFQQSGKNMVAAASKGYGEEVEKVAKVVEELSQVKNVPERIDIRVPLVDNVTKASKESKTMPKVCMENVNELKIGNADRSCPRHNSQYDSVGDKVHHLEKVKVAAKGMHKEENVSGGSNVKKQKASKKSKVVSRVYPVNLDEQMNVNPDISQNKTRSGINGDTLHHLKSSMEGKSENKVTNLITFGLYCDEEHLVQTRETAMNFEGVESAKIDASKGMIMVIGAVDQEKLLSYLEENLKRDVLVVPIQRNDIAGDGNMVIRDINVAQWPQMLKEDAVRCGGDGNRHRGADEVKMKVKEVAAFGNVSGAWRKDKLGEFYTDIDSLYLQNYDVDSQLRCVYPAYRYVSPFSDENAQSCSIM